MRQTIAMSEPPKRFPNARALPPDERPEPMDDEPRRILGDRASTSRAPLWIWHTTEDARLNHSLGRGWLAMYAAP